MPGRYDYCRGVTLVELLVVAAVVVVLLSIMIPTLRYFRVKEDDLKNLNNLRATMQDFFAWSAQHDDRAPNAGRPWDQIVPGYYEWQGDLEGHYAYFTQRRRWPLVLAESGFPPGLHWHSTSGPDASPREWDGWLDAMGSRAYAELPSRYRFPAPMRTRWDIWRDPPFGPIASYAHFLENGHVVRWGEVRFPAGKGVLAHTDRRGAALWHVAFADGRAALVNPDASSGCAVSPMSRTGAPGQPVFETLEGYRGRDF